jgi:formylglycine-generating enzyme required for sulfatase activity
MSRRLLFVILLLGFTTSAAAQNRTALVIGNSDYADAPLKNPANDARDMAKTLRQLGFEVIERINANQEQMDKAIDAFGRTLEKKQGVGLLFFAGHGIQSKGENYLLPVDASIDREPELRYKAINASRILDEMGYANNGLNIAILDACRNNPLTRSFRNSSRGLARISNAPKGLFLAYSTDPGNVAMDGDGRNSPFTSELLKTMTRPGLPIEQVFKQVRRNVERTSRGKQTPFTTSSLSGDFYFVEADGSDSKPIQLAGGSVELTTPQPGPTATLVVDSDPPGARVRLNGGDVGKTPITIPQLVGGNYTLQADKAGHTSESKKLFLIAGQKRTVKLILDPLNAALQSHPFTIKTTPANARVRIMNINPRYQDGMELADGDYDVLVDAPGYHSWRQTISHAGRATWQQVTLTAKPAATTSGSFNDPATGMEFVAIEGGCFQMGSPASESGRDDNERQHRVCVEGFSMGKHEVTQGQWRAVMGSNPSHFSGCGDDCPVEDVSWHDVQDFVQRLNSKTGRTYRLPTEAEWEYACRGGKTNDTYCGGNDVDRLAWYDGNSGSRKHAVGGKTPNAFGLYDMSGNVWEWTCSRYDNSYSGAEKSCSAHADSSGRALRGGSWVNNPAWVRAAVRSGFNPVYRFSNLGFRLVSPAR